MEVRNGVKDDNSLVKNAQRDSIGIDARSVGWFIRILIGIIGMEGSRTWSNINFQQLFSSSPVTSHGLLNTSFWKILFRFSFEKHGVFDKGFFF